MLFLGRPNLNSFHSLNICIITFFFSLLVRSLTHPCTHKYCTHLDVCLHPIDTFQRACNKYIQTIKQIKRFALQNSNLFFFLDGIVCDGNGCSAAIVVVVSFSIWFFFIVRVQFIRFVSSPVALLLLSMRIESLCRRKEKPVSVSFARLLFRYLRSVYATNSCRTFFVFSVNSQLFISTHKLCVCVRFFLVGSRYALILLYFLSIWSPTHSPLITHTSIYN